MRAISASRRASASASCALRKATDQPLKNIADSSTNNMSAFKLNWSQRRGSRRMNTDVSLMASIDVQKCVQIEHRQRELGQRLRGQKLQRQSLFFFCRPAAGGELIGQLHVSLSVVARAVRQSPCESFSQTVRR